MSTKLANVRPLNFTRKFIVLLKVLALHLLFFARNKAVLGSSPQKSVINSIFSQLPDCEVYHFSIGSNSEYSSEIMQAPSSRSTSGVYSALVNSKKLTNQNDIVIYQRFQDIHKYSTFCGVALFYFENSQFVTEKKMFKKLFSQFTPLYEPLLRKDEDYFIFVAANEQQAHSILMSSDFGAKIKYKITLIIPPRHALMTRSSCIVQTVHLYADLGKPIINTIFKSNSIKSIPYSKDLSLETLFVDSTKKFHGKCFSMSIPKVAFRFETIWNSEMRKYVPRRGYYKWWLEEAMTRFNFTYNMFESSSGGGTGKIFKNGSWIGSVADILDGRGDWAFVVGHIYSRHKYVEWSAPLSYEQMVFLNHKPIMFISPKAIFWPFSPFIWALFLVSILGVPLVFKMILKAKNHHWSYGSMLEYVYTTFVEQDHKGPYDSPMLALRILGIFWLLYAMIISTAYRGKLTSLLAFPTSSWVPKSFEELANSHFRVGLNVVGKGGAAYSIFSSNLSSPVYKTLFERMELYPNADDCLIKATKEDLCCIMWQGVADYIIARNLSDRFGNIPLQPSTETTSFIADGLVWEKRAVFRKHLDRSIWSSIEGGLVPLWFQFDQRFLKHEKWKNEITKHRSEVNTRLVEKGPKKLELSHFKGIFFILFGGVILSLIKFSFEINILQQFMQIITAALAVNRIKK